MRWRFGSKAPDAALRLANVASVTAVGGQLWVLDAGTFRLEVLDPQGQHLGGVDLRPALAGVGQAAQVMQVLEAGPKQGLLLVEAQSPDKKVVTALLPLTLP